MSQLLTLQAKILFQNQISTNKSKTLNILSHSTNLFLGHPFTATLDPRPFGPTISLDIYLKISFFIWANKFQLANPNHSLILSHSMILFLGHPFTATLEKQYRDLRLFGPTISLDSSSLPMKRKSMTTKFVTIQLLSVVDGWRFD